MVLGFTEDTRSPLRSLRVVLLGKTGSGKSATGNTILKRTAFLTEMSPSSVTKTFKKERAHFDKRSVSVVDTPGIFDTTISEDNLKKEIEKSFLTEPHAFLFVIRLDARFTEEEKKAIEWIKYNFGDEVSKYTLVVFTRGDTLKKSLEEYLDQSSELREFISGYKSGYTVFDNTCMMNRSQVADLFEKIDRMVQLNEGFYTNSMYEEAQRKVRRKQLWNKCGDSLISASNYLMGAAAAVAAPAAGAAVVAEEVAATAFVRSGLMVAGAAVTKYVGGWMKPKTHNE